LQDSGTGTPVTLKIDPKGFFLYWVDQNHEVDLLDIATIRDARTGPYAKIPKVIFIVLEMIISGQDGIAEKNYALNGKCILFTSYRLIYSSALVFGFSLC
jgi:hypothetical protein